MMMQSCIMQRTRHDRSHPAMRFQSQGRAHKVAVAASIFMLLIAMLLPVCHLHPLLDKGAPDHCAICVSLHAAAPLGVHVPAGIALLQAGRVFVVAVPRQSQGGSHFDASRAPPLSSC
jgi:hypothetical protein